MTDEMDGCVCRELGSRTCTTHIATQRARKPRVAAAGRGCYPVASSCAWCGHEPLRGDIQRGSWRPIILRILAALRDRWFSVRMLRRIAVHVPARHRHVAGHVDRDLPQPG